MQSVRGDIARFRRHAVEALDVCRQRVERADKDKVIDAAVFAVRNVVDVIARSVATVGAPLKRNHHDEES